MSDPLPFLGDEHGWEGGMGDRDWFLALTHAR